MTSDEIHLFYLRTGFEYFFSLQLIEYLGLDRVILVMNEPREGIEQRASERYPVIYTKDSLCFQLLGKKVSKLRFARRVFAEAGLRDRKVHLYSPVYNETCIYALREQMEKACREVHYSMIPDGAALLRHLPLKEGKASGQIRWLYRWYKSDRADGQHFSGSYSAFLEKVYHYPAKKIYADPAKVEIVPLPISDRVNNGGVFVVGGLAGASREFVRAALEMAGDSPVEFRMHPRNRSGLEFIQAEAPKWVELGALEGSLEEHFLAHPYRLVLGPYSTSLMFNHLFVDASRSHFLIDTASADPNWRATAKATGIPVTDVAPPLP